MRKSALAGVAGAGILALSLAACSSSPQAAPTKTADSNAPLSASVPAEFRDGITVAVQTNNPPLSFQKDGKTVGEDPDLLAEVSKLLGIEITIDPQSFENMLLGLDQGKYDFVVQTDITEARKAKYDQLAQFVDAYTFLTTAENDDIGDQLSDVCGLKIGTQTGANNTAFLGELSKKCVADGNPAITIVALPDVPSLYLAAASGRVQAVSAPLTVLGYFVSSDQDKLGKQWRLTGPEYLNMRAGWTFPTGSKLIFAVQEALTQMMKEGSYQKILTDWGLEGNIADKAEIDPDIQ